MHKNTQNLIQMQFVHESKPFAIILHLKITFVFPCDVAEPDYANHFRATLGMCLNHVTMTKEYKVVAALCATVISGNSSVAVKYTTTINFKHAFSALPL